MSYSLSFFTVIAMAQLASASPLLARQVATNSATDSTPATPATNGPNMGAFIGWSSLALLVATFTGVAIWAMIRGQKHKKEKYGKKAVEMQVRDAAVAHIVEAAEDRNARANNV